MLNCSSSTELFVTFKLSKHRIGICPVKTYICLKSKLLLTHLCPTSLDLSYLNTKVCVTPNLSDFFLEVKVTCSKQSCTYPATPLLLFSFKYSIELMD